MGQGAHSKMGHHGESNRRCFSYIIRKIYRHKNVNHGRHTNNRTSLSERRLQPPRDCPKLGISRTTVDKVLAQYEATQETSDNEALDNLLTLQPAYNSRGRKPRRLSQSIAAEIDRYLELNAQRRRQGMRKQQLKKIDIWQILSGQGIQISYPSVCRYVTNKEKASRPGGTKADVRQAYAP